VAFAAVLAGCASSGSVTPTAVSDVKSLAGKWTGLMYGPAPNQTDQVVMTIGEDGAYEIVTYRTIGEARGRGRIMISDGQLVLQGEKGRGSASVMTRPDGGRVMKVDATLNDNTPMSATLSPAR